MSKFSRPLVYSLFMLVFLVSQVVSLSLILSDYTIDSIEKDFYHNLKSESIAIADKLYQKNKKQFNTCFLEGECDSANFNYRFIMSVGDIPFSSAILLEKDKKGNITILGEISDQDLPISLMLNRNNFTKQAYNTFMSGDLNIATKEVPLWGKFHISYVPIINYFKKEVSYVLRLEVSNTFLETKYNRVRIATSAYMYIGILFSILLSGVLYGFLYFDGQRCKRKMELMNNE